MTQIVEMFKQRFSEIASELNEYIDKTDRENIDFPYITNKLSPIDEIMKELSLPHSVNDREEMMTYWQSESDKVIKRYENKI